MDFIHDAILDAKLGRERKAAQQDTCGIFAAALHDVLNEMGLDPKIRCAAFSFEGSRRAEWYHAVVCVGETLYDSMGRFDHEIVRNRIGIHRSVRSSISVRDDDRESCWEDELSELHTFYFKELQKSLAKHPS